MTSNAIAPAPRAARRAYALANVNTGRVDRFTLPIARVAASLGCSVTHTMRGTQLWDAHGRLAYVRG